MNYLDITLKLKASALEAVCDTFPRDERQWPNVIAGTKEQKNLTSILIPLSRKLIKKSHNLLNKDNASKTYRVSVRYYEAHALEQWLGYIFPKIDYGYERNACYALYNTLNQEIA